MGRKPTGKPRGRPPKPTDEKYEKIRVSLAPEVREDLDFVADRAHDGNRSAAVAALAVKEAARLRKRAKK